MPCSFWGTGGKAQEWLDLAGTIQGQCPWSWPEAWSLRAKILNSNPCHEKSLEDASRG